MICYRSSKPSLYLKASVLIKVLDIKLSKSSLTVLLAQNSRISGRHSYKNYTTEFLVLQWMNTPAVSLPPQPECR